MTDFPDDLGDMTYRDAKNLSPEQNAIIFATEYDDNIVALLDALKRLGFTEEDYAKVLEKADEFLALAPLPKGGNVTVREMMPWVHLNDLIVTGLLAKEAWDRRDQIQDIIDKESGPF